MNAKSAPSQTALDAANKTRADISLWNCEQMSYISSSGLRCFLILQKSVQKNQGSLIIEAMRPEIKNIFEMTGCTSLFNIR